MSLEFRIGPLPAVRFRYPAGRSRLSLDFTDTRPTTGCPWYVQCLPAPAPKRPIITLNRQVSRESWLDGAAGYVGLVLVLSFPVSLCFPGSPYVVIEGCLLGFAGLLLCLAAVIARSGRRCGLLGVIVAAVAAGFHILFAMTG